MASAFDRTNSRRGPALSLWRALMAVGVVAALVPGAFGWGFSVSVVNNAPRYSIVPTPGAFGWEYMDTPSTSPAALTGVSGTTFGFNFKCSGGFSSSTSVLRLGYDVTCPDGVYTWRIAVQLYCRHELWSTSWDSPASVSLSAPAGAHPCAVFSVPIDVHGSPQGLGEGQTLVVTITDFGPPPPPHAYAHAHAYAKNVRPVSTPCGPAPSDPVLYAEQSQPLVNGPCQGRYLSPTATQSECVELHGRCCSREKGGVGVSAVSNALPCGFCYASPPALLHQHLGAGEPYASVDGGANAGGANAGVPPAPLVGCSCQTTFVGTCNLRANTCAAGTRPQCTYEGAKKYCTCACVH